MTRDEKRGGERARSQEIIAPPLSPAFAATYIAVYSDNPSLLNYSRLRKISLKSFPSEATTAYHAQLQQHIHTYIHTAAGFPRKHLRINIK